ncbi:hypothetical protein ABZZ17_33225 [Streptomyces sp. NPDC006512]|uniref:hypothetical protein n=1 Tax=Streptomyces sp. NPDC006512 TaxID=3154307 RepID=UPI00339F5E77
MTAYHIKYLPVGALPGDGAGTWSVARDGVASRSRGGVATWPVADAERWRKAAVPAVLAPAVGGWVLAVLVAAAYVMLFGLSSASAAWHSGPGDGTDWRRYPGLILLTALPLWYRHVPVAAVPAAVFVAVEAVLVLGRPGGVDQPARAGWVVILAACAVAFTGSCLRLRARRRQRALALAAAGGRRFPLPEGTPESDGHRGHRQVYLGLVLCLVSAAILADGLFGGSTAPDVAYDAVGEQGVALVLLVAGTTIYGRGQLAYRAARRLHGEPQPALIVGVRAGADGRHWVCSDARTRSAAPLIAYVPRKSDTHARTRLLGSGSAYGAGNGHHDIDPEHEPFEAVLYGTLAEGDEVVLEYACAEYHQQEMGRMYATVTTVPLRPDRRHGLGPWEPADGAARQRERLREEREREERYREAQRAAEARRRNAPRGSSSRGRGSGSSSRGRGSGSGNRYNGGGCGSGCGSGCGGD